MQVELAQYKYRLPRLSGLGHQLSRLGGGIGTRGPGETKLETDRRNIRNRIHDLETQVAKLKNAVHKQSTAHKEQSTDRCTGWLHQCW